MKNIFTVNNGLNFESRFLLYFLSVAITQDSSNLLPVMTKSKAKIDASEIEYKTKLLGFP